MTLLVEHDGAYWAGYWFGTILMLVILLGIYLLPGIIALKRATPNRTWIILLDVLGGWTVLGWIGALVWAILDRRPAATGRPLAGGPQVSADGRWYWDGAAWQPIQQGPGGHPV